MSDYYDLHAAAGYQLTLISRIYERRFECNLATIGLTRVKWCVLLAVGQEGHSAPSDIAEFIGIDRTATSRALRGMESDRFITRSSGSADKRMREVRITAKGRAGLDEANNMARGNAEHFTQKITWYEQDLLKTIIKKLMTDEARNVSGL